MSANIEEAVLADSPLVVSLGGEQYKLKPLPMIKMMAWRQEFAPKLASVTEAFSTSLNSADDFLAPFIGAPQTMIDAVFAYAPDLPKDKILETCTENELFIVFTKVMGVAFGPFLGQAAFLMGFRKEIQKVIQPASEPSSILH